MTIKEFSHKHSLVFFWTTVVLALLLILTGAARMHGGRGYMMRGGNNMRGGMQGGQAQGQQRQMMDPNNPNQPLINDTPNAAGTVEAGAPVNPSAPVEAQ